MNVDLPSPFAPIRPICSPFSRRNDTSLKIARSPKPWASLRRLIGWIALWPVEMCLVLPVLAPAGMVGGIGAAALLYTVLTLGAGYGFFKYFRSKR